MGQAIDFFGASTAHSFYCVRVEAVAFRVCQLILHWCGHTHDVECAHQAQPPSTTTNRNQEPRTNNNHNHNNHVDFCWCSSTALLIVLQRRLTSDVGLLLRKAEGTGRLSSRWGQLGPSLRLISIIVPLSVLNAACWDWCVLTEGRCSVDCCCFWVLQGLDVGGSVGSSIEVA